MKKIEVTFTDDKNIDAFLLGQLVTVCGIEGTITNIVNEEPDNSAPLGTYFCDGLTVSRGTWVSGSIENLKVKDQNFLTIRSNLTGNYQYVDFVANFNVKGNTANKLKLTFVSKYSGLRGQNLYIFNAQLQRWVTLKYSSVGQAGLDVIVELTNPNSFIDQDGSVKIRMYCYSSSSFVGYYDMMKLEVL